MNEKVIHFKFHLKRKLLKYFNQLNKLIESKFFIRFFSDFKINFSQLESCGVIEQRLNIHAQEDVYSMTRVKVTEFQKIEEQTKKQFV
jgi:hypothetical protein